MPALPSLRPQPRAGRTSAPGSGPDPVVDCAVYLDGQRRAGSWGYAEALADVRRRGSGFVWVGLHAPTAEQMAGVAATFGLHELAVEDAVHAHQRPKLEHYDDTVFMVLKTITYVPHESITTAKEIVEAGEVMVFVGADFVVTVRHGRHTELSGLRQRLEDTPQRLALGPATVLHALADHVVDAYLEVADAVEDDVDTLEEQIFSPRTQVDIEQIYLLKREVVELRRAVTPLGAALRMLVTDREERMPVEVRHYFRDVEDHQSLVADRVGSYDEMLTSLVDAALAKVSTQQNGDMRKIASYAAIITVPTFIAGLYGMNFTRMPFLDSAVAFWVTIVFMVAVCAGLWTGFRRSGWL